MAKEATAGVGPENQARGWRNRVFRHGNADGQGARAARSALVIVVVLVMVVLLALLVAGFTFLVRAHVSQSYARLHEYQARLAAEAGIQRAVIELRKSRTDPLAWYDNPILYRQATVERVEGAETFQSNATGRQALPTEEKRAQAEPIWRFTLYAPSPNEEPTPQVRPVRYGITPETSKLDINMASAGQLRRLIENAVPATGPNQEQIDREALLDCLLDWREPGTTARTKGAKDEYYQTLRPAFLCKKGRCDTVEELLQIKGFSAFIVFGEDYNRNGLLDPNEDDGAASFPPDNADGKLEHGLAPYLTVFSREVNVNSANKPRINLNSRDMTALEQQFAESGIDGKIVDYVMRIRGMGLSFRSVMDLLPVPPEEPSEEGTTSQPGDQSSQQGDTTSQPSSGTGQTEQSSQEEATSQPSANNPRTGGTSQQRKSKQSRRPGRGTSSQPSQTEGQGVSGDSSSEGDGTQGAQTAEGVEQQVQEALQQGGTTSRPSGGGQQPLTNLTDEIPPGTISDLPVLLDKLTTDPLPVAAGRININSAARPVLLALGVFTAEEVNAIVSAREALSGDDMKTPAWLLTQGLVSERTFRRVLNRITASSSTFYIDAVGFADHVGVIKRLGVVIEMRGPIPQVLYYRDLGPLGPAYTPHGEENRGVVSRTEK